MSVSSSQHRTDLERLDDAALVGLARHGDEQAIATIIRRHNRRLFRVARAVLRSDVEAEDVVQASYVKAFTHLDGYRAEAQLSTWLTRIALNDALSRLRRQRPTTGVEQLDIESARAGGNVLPFPFLQAQPNPEAEMSRMEVRLVLERVVDELPDPFRAVFVLRDIEGMSIEETAGHLSIRPETVKTRLHRARRLLRVAIEHQLSGAFAELFPFDGDRCAHMANRVLAQLRTRS
jgi:RNA polymerase sigma-70 factor (ECF subfamily)